VPIYGFTLIWYSLLDDNLNPDIGVGIISASTQQCINYIKKLKIYDAYQMNLDEKFLFLSVDIILMKN
jgi:hypothetical protein